jgi:hypothetical protein
MVQRVAYLSKLHDIPPSLVVNLIKTIFHLVPTRGFRTWEQKDLNKLQYMEKKI